jgi:hypothetical protein
MMHFFTQTGGFLTEKKLHKNLDSKSADVVLFQVLYIYHERSRCLSMMINLFAVEPDSVPLEFFSTPAVVQKKRRWKLEAKSGK